MKPERWKEIEEIYHRAQQRDALARPDFLDQACAGDAELRRQVESLLKADGDAESFLDTPAMNLAAQMIADEQKPSLVGKRISRYDPRRSTGTDILLLRLDGERKLEPFLHTCFEEFGPEFSPDGQWIAYVSNESGRNEVYVLPFPGPGPKRQVSTTGGTSPCWARNRKELFYRNGNKMMAVDVSLQPVFKAGAPRVLVEGDYEGIGRPDSPRHYDVTADGQRFVMIKSHEGPSAPSQLIVALEWLDDLKRRVPVGSN
jgi:serine/threonine-protein kinase